MATGARRRRPDAPSGSTATGCAASPRFGPQCADVIRRPRCTRPRTRRCESEAPAGTATGRHAPAAAHLRAPPKAAVLLDDPFLVHPGASPGNSLRSRRGRARLTFHPGSPHVSPDTCLRLLSDSFPTGKVDRATKKRLPVEEKKPPREAQREVSTSRRWGVRPGGADDVKGPYGAAWMREEGEDKWSSPATRPGLRSGRGFPRKNREYSPVVPTTRVKVAAPPTPLRAPAVNRRGSGGGLARSETLRATPEGMKRRRNGVLSESLS